MVGVVILVVAFIALRPSAEDEGSTAETPTETPTVATPTETPDGGRDADADPPRRLRVRRSTPGRS